MKSLSCQNLCDSDWRYFNWVRKTLTPKLWYANMPTFVFLHKKYLFKAVVFTYRVRLINSWIFCVLPLLARENDQYSFSQPFCAGRICVDSGFPNFWSNDIWQIKFSWNKVVRVDIYGNHKWYAIRKSLGTTAIELNCHFSFTNKIVHCLKFKCAQINKPNMCFPALPISFLISHGGPTK